MSSLTTVEYLNIASIAYADFEQSDVGSTLDDLIRDGSISSSLLQDPARAAFADPDFPLRDWELVGVKDGGLNGFFAIALKDPTTGEIVFSFRGSQDVADWTLSNFQITTSLLTPAQFAVAEQFVFETLNTAGPVCYNTLSDMYDAVGSSSNVSFTGHSLGGGLAQYMTYKTADFNDTDSGAASVTFNAVGIGQALDDLSLLASAPYYNSVDHVNSNDVVGGYGMQLGQTIRHIDDSEIDYSRVDFAILSEMIFVQIKAAEGTLDAVQASKQLSDLKLALNLKSPESYLHTMSVFVGYSGVGGDGVSFSSYHGLDNFLMDNPNGDGQVMTATVTSQSDYLKLGAIFQLVNALQVINISKSEGNYTTNVSTLPPALQVTSSGGVDYYSPYSHGLENYNYTYSQAAIAYANSIVQNASRNLKASSLAQPYVEYQQAIASNVQRIDPLILDLDNDGIETIHINNSNAFFDLDLNGFAENTSWADSDDGFLVLDRNQDGIINNASELFGDRTLLDDGVTYASSGFQALAEYDENADGVIDTIDSIYSLLRVWQDANGDGVSAASELKSLLDLGIVSIALSYLNTGITDSADNIQVRVGEFTLADGSTSAIGEYLFNRDTANSIEEPLVNVPPEIAVLPNIQGAGNVSSLYKAMLDDTSGDLQNLVEDFLAEDDAMARNALIEQIIIKWTGSDSIDTTSRGGLFDAQKLAAMEKFYGLNFNGNPTANSVNLLTSSYNKLVENMYVSFIAETHLKDILGLVDVDFSGNLIFTDVRDEVDSLLATNEATGLSTLSELTRVVKHYGLGDTDGFMALRNYYAVQSDVYAKAIDFAGTKPLVGTSSDDYLSTSGNQTALDGGEGSDYLYANTTSSVALYGGAGNDNLYGSVGSDILNGGTGNDRLEGGTSNDTYMFGHGFGVDTIADRDATEGNIDTIRFLDDVASEDVIARRNGNNLELSILGTEDKLIVEQYFSRYYSSGWYSYDIGENGNKVEQIIFADGTTWGIVDIKEMARNITGTAGSDSLGGYDDQNDIVLALDGDDYVTTNAGNDVIDGGTGNDTIYAGIGNDALTGGAGNDSLYANDGNDILDGGTGDDALWGETGNDTYVFGRGYGVDTIRDRDATEGNEDVIQFASDIEPADIIVRRSGNNLELLISGTEDKLIVEQYFSRYYSSGWYSYDIGEDGNKVEQIIFSDGTAWSIADVKEKARNIVGTAGDESLNGYDDQDDRVTALDGNDYITTGAGADVIDAGAGNDTLHAASGNDTLLGGAGNDMLYSGEGNDTLDGGDGNDQLWGETGDDVYIFGRGYGIDTIVDRDAAEGNQDTVRFTADIAPSDILVRRSGNNLELQIIGTDDKLIVEQYFSRYYSSGWYSYDIGENGNKIEVVEFADGTTWDMATVLNKARFINGTDQAETIYGYETNEVIAAGAGDDVVYASSGDDVVNAGDGSDIVYGDYGNDTLQGEAGNDTVYGGEGSDILDGGTGNDLLEGGTGNDTYIFGIGYGVDTIYDSDGSENNQDTIQFLEGIDPQDVVVARSGSNLELSISGTTDKLIIEHYFNSYTRNGYYTGSADGNKIEQIKFTDGTTWSIADVKDKARYINGTSNGEQLSGFGDQQNIIAAGDGNDTVYAGGLGDQIDGGAGNDSLFGSSGSDTLTGGAGNDQLEGHYGNDRYVFASGFGNDTIYDLDSTEGNVDTIQFLEGIDPADVVARRSGDDLVLGVTGTSDSLTIDQYFSQYTRNGYNAGGSDAQKVEVIEFANGTVWSISDIKDKVRYITGTDNNDYLSGFSDQQDFIFAGAGDDTLYASGDNGDELRGEAGNDTLYGSYGSDTLNGGTGNDALEGSAGNDVYLFGLGYGTDTIYDNDTTVGNQDTIQFLLGITPEDIVVKRSGDNLELSIVNTTDKLIVQNYFSGYYRNSGYYAGENANKIEAVVFADGTSWDTATVSDKARHIAGTEDGDVISGFSTDDVIMALAGDDAVYASSGNDIVHGGDGNDQVYGDSGNDQLFGNVGNDTLYGADGQDALDGGAGTDLLEGSYGNDTYVFGIGYGQDTIYDNDTTESNLDIVSFLPGISPADVAVRRNGDNLELRITGTEDVLVVERYFSPYARNSWYTYNTDMNKVEEFHFDNGTIWDVATIADKARYIDGTDQADTLSGFSTDDVITAGAGDDTVYASSGSDTVNAGDGNDILYGDSGNDILRGNAGNDSIYGSDGNDTLDGSTGTDLLEGSYGNDTYIFGLGYGTDIIYDNDTTQGNVDAINLQAGISPEDVLVKRNGDNLELHITGTADTLIVERYFSPYARNSWYTYDVNMNKIEQIVFDDGTIWDIATIADKARYMAGTEDSDTISGFDTNDVIRAGAGDDTVYASSGDDIVHGNGGNDMLYGDSGSDQLFGDAGNDTLHGADGNDVFDGGAGNDLLEGSYGNDTYVFGIGSGVDTIYDNDTTQANMDIVNFLPGIDPANVNVRRNGDNLELGIAGTEDTLIIERYFSPYARNSWYTYNVNMNKVEEFHFDNGTIWDVSTILDKARFITGTSGNDSLYGYGDQENIINAGEGTDTIYAAHLGDELYGEAGNDSLYGSSGTDILDGGIGNDILEGSAGNDTYIFSLGFGVDTIYDNDTTQSNVDVINFQAGIAAEDVLVKRNGDNLELRVAGTTDMLIVERYFSPYARGSWYTYNYSMNKIEQIVFNDGTVWDIATVLEKARIIDGTEASETISGFSDQQNIITAGTGDDIIYAGSQGDQIDAGDGNDTVYGSSGSDRITGGIGNDILEGSTGNDTYVFAPGFGVDTIYDNDNGQGNSFDIVEFAANIAAEDVVVRRLSNGDLELTVLGTSDKLTIERYFSNYYRNSSWNTGTNSNAIEEFRFADGTVWDIADIKDKARFIEGTTGDDSISGFGDQQNIITAGDGNDTIYAGSSLNDELYGEGGNDTLMGTWNGEKFDGGVGNDYMEGSAGNDTYVFGLGYGQDVIYDSTQGQSAGLDKVTFLEGIDPANVGVKRLSNSDLEITFAGTSDKLTIERYFSNYYKNSSWNTGTDSNVVEELHFADGTIWTAAIIKEKVRTMNGTGNNDTLQGFSDQQNLIYAGTGDDVLYAGGMSGDKLYGEADNDIFYGSWASETLDGGTGNDLMEGNAGDDTYVFGLGYGQDTIYDSNQGQGSGLDKVTFLAGINPADVTAKRLQNSDLELTFAESSDKLTIERFFSNYYKNSTWNTGANSNVIEEFHFADNTVWDLDDIKTMVRTVNGTENNDALYGYEDADTITAGSGDDSVYASQGDDTISGNAGNDSLYGEDGSDILDGGTGNDTLHGGYGNDTYVFSGAFGNDQVNDYHGNDLVQFGDLGKDSLIFEQVGNALRIIPGGSSDSISIDYWYSYNDYKIETIKDANGNTINSSQVEQLIQAMASWSNDNNGMSWSQALSSNSQDVQNIMAQYWTAPTV